MGFRFRKSIKIAPGIKLNVGKKGINSVSIGGHGYTKNIGKHGTRTTVGIPGTGISYSNYKKYGSNKKKNNASVTQDKLTKAEKLCKWYGNMELKYRDIPFEINKISFFSKSMGIQTGIAILFFILGIVIHPAMYVFMLIDLIVFLFNMLFNKKARARRYQDKAVKTYHFSNFIKCIKLCEKSLRLVENESTRKLMDLSQKCVDNNVQVDQLNDQQVKDIVRHRKTSEEIAKELKDK
ncbi:DUF4236 domain-containing protein [Clostridium tyrobutyricum]|uniref:DUF4236 domain-containing protein n=1 Tax=Clostridium tyrobutyricum TaxID=1519 RepID=UPI001C39126A|nr:DUF4236 domain-containing protein [Clostridium tyrobutyricum]MBV4417190.1 DUF4236 domain-containing protein [Clostridium tyrobutyricum]